MPKSNKETLKGYFKAGSIPTESNFNDLIDSFLLVEGDGFSKSLDSPLKLNSSGAGKQLVQFFENFSALNALPELEIKLASGGALFSKGNQNLLYLGTQTGNVGIGNTTPLAKLDIQLDARSGSHPTTAKGLYVSGNFGPDSDGVEFRHSNATQGIGFGYQSIYATGTNANQNLNLLPRGTGGVGIGTGSPAARLTISEAVGTVHGGNSGTLILDHENSGGASSIVFRSKVNRGSDYGYIQFQDNAAGGANEKALLTIGIQNDAEDHIALMPSGNVGIRTTDPKGELHVEVTAHSAWNKFVVKGTSLWGDGLNDTPSETDGMKYVTIGAQTGGIMLSRPHVVWNAGDSAAGIRYGRSKGIGSGEWWEAGVNQDAGFHIRKSAAANSGLEISSNGTTSTNALRIGMNGGTVLNKLQAGTASLGNSAAGGAGAIKVYTVKFPDNFSNIPKVICTARTQEGQAHPDTFSITTKQISKTQFVINVVRTDAAGGGWAQNLLLDWIAFE